MYRICWLPFFIYFQIIDTPSNIFTFLQLVKNWDCLNILAMMSKYQRLILTLDTLKDLNEDSWILRTLCIRLTFITMLLPFLGLFHLLRLRETKQIPNLETWSIAWIAQVFLLVTEKEIEFTIESFTLAQIYAQQKALLPKFSVPKAFLQSRLSVSAGRAHTGWSHQHLHFHWFVEIVRKCWRMLTWTHSYQSANCSNQPFQLAPRMVHFQLRPTCALSLT